MYLRSSSREQEDQILLEASEVLSQWGYEVARDVMLSSSSAGIITTVDLVGRSQYGTIIVEAKTTPASGAALSSFFQAAATLTQETDPEQPVALVLTIPSSPPEPIELAARYSHVAVVTSQDLKEKLQFIVQHQMHRKQRPTG